ncbi:DUF2442 domain-containing protein [Nibricoccus sp. IMCC34717]|uniref:DUF2442 domain-containing protein n=1 Tax=Nibricoccus sp. IMCC34717 TaxID=3034021 RepID=UPI00384F425E
MSFSIQAFNSARFSDGYIVLDAEGGVRVSFPVKGNPRLEGALPSQLNRIEISPFGLHWPDLDEDLSFEGIAKGDFGQRRC